MKVAEMDENFVFFLSQWRYCIRLENMGSEVVQLRERHWRIFSLSGTLETVRGRGVVGRVSTFTLMTLLCLSVHVLWESRFYGNPEGSTWRRYEQNRDTGVRRDPCVTAERSVTPSSAADGRFSERFLLIRHQSLSLNLVVLVFKPFLIFWFSPLPISH